MSKEDHRDTAELFAEAVLLLDKIRAELRGLRRAVGHMNQSLRKIIGEIEHEEN